MHRLTNKILACFFIVFIFFSICSTYSARAQCTFTGPTGTVCAGNACDGNAATFQGPVNATKYEWDFGVQSDTTDISSEANPSYRYEQPGTYTVTLKATINGQVQTCTQPVTVAGVPEFTITPDENLGPQEEEICIGSSVDLTPNFANGAPPAGSKYLWSTGDTTQIRASVDSAGCYSLTITSPDGCTRTNKVTVTLYKPDPAQPAPPQDQARWFFGNGGGIRFPGGQPVADANGTATGKPINAQQSSSSVLNAKGELLFYTDGITVFDTTGIPLNDAANLPVTSPRQADGGNGLNGSPTSTQGVTIVAQPGCSDCQSVYYVFTTSEVKPGGSLLSYSVVDMRLNGGKGQVTEKNIPLFTTSTERVIAVEGNPADSTAPPTKWIITHDFNSNTFRVYALTPDGVGAAETYNVGSIHGTQPEKGEGYMKISPDGTKLAVVIPGVNGGNNTVEIFDFDNSTGEVSNPIDLNLGAAPPSAYGLEFAGNELYVSLSGSTTDPSQLVRFDISSGDSLVIALSKDTVATSNKSFGALQVGPDQKIYLAIQNSTSLGVINNPTASDTAQIDFQEDGFDLDGGTSDIGLPNNSPSESQSYGQDFAYEGPGCTNLNTPVQYRFQAQPDRAGGDPTKSTYLWTFPNGVTYTTAEVNHSFPGPGSYIVGLTIFNDCKPQGEVIPAKTIVISENPPIVNLGADRNVCPTTNPVTLSAYAANINPAGVSYNWIRPDGSIVRTKTINATLPGNYTVVVISANGECTQTDNININFQSPTVNLGADTTLCQGGSLVLNAGNPGASFAWFNVTTNTAIPGNTQFITVTPAGPSTTYRVTVTDTAFPTCPVSDEIIVRNGTPPLVTAATTPAASCNNSTGTIALSAPPVGDRFTYVWSNGETTPNITAAPGTYTVIVTNASGCSTTISAAINVVNSPLSYTADAPRQATCANPTGTITLTKAAASTVGTSFIWRDSNGQTITTATGLQLVNAPIGTYSVEITDAGGCKFSLTDLRIDADLNTPNTPNPTAIVIGCDPLAFNATLFSGYNGVIQVTYQWFGPNSNVTQVPAAQVDPATGRATVTQPGTYIVRVTNSVNNACTAEASVTVTSPSAPPFNIPDQSFCPLAPNQGVEVNATTAGYDRYEWKNSANVVVSSGPRFLVTQPANVTSVTFTITAKNSSTGCTATDQVTISFDAPVPGAPTVPSLAICAGQPVPQLTATGTNIRWFSNAALTTQVGSGNQFRPNINPATAAVYTFFVTQTNATGCQSAAAQVTLTVNPIPGSPSVANPNQVICAGSGVAAFTISAPASNSYKWYTNAALTNPVDLDASFTPNLSSNAIPGEYLFYVTQTLAGANTCESKPTVVKVTINRSPVVNLPDRLTICIDDSTLLDVTNPGATYLWSNTQTTPTIRPTRSGIYSVTVTIGTCSVTDQVEVTILPSVKTNVPRREATLCLNDRPIRPVTLDAGPGAGFTYFWPQLNKNDRTVEVSQPDIYEVLITDEASGCTKTERITVTAKCEPRITVPQAFTPNPERDNNNNELQVFGDYITDFEMQIFNRWGEVVFATKSADLSQAEFWDGTYLNKPAPLGSYAWKISYKSKDFPDRETTVLRGGVMLIR